MNRFVIAEPGKCIGCRTCEVACVLAHKTGHEEGSVLSPANFTPRLKTIKGKKYTAPVQCRQCENAPCVNVCPTEALFYQDDTVQLDVNFCVGCQTCVLACPFGAIEMVKRPAKQPGLGPKTIRASVLVANKCDLCLGIESGPACMKVCPTKALHLIDSEAAEKNLREKRAKAAFDVLPENIQAK